MARSRRIDAFELLSHRDHLPVFAFRTSEAVERFSVYDVSETLRGRGWIVPAYPMPPAIEDLHVMRICVRNGFSRDLAELLLGDLRKATKKLERRGGDDCDPAHRASFHH